MSAVEGLPAPPVPVEPATTDRPMRALPSLCPYLATLDGTWRSAAAVREHRCMAVSPPVPLAAEKQRRLCLVDRHIDCATYGAAVASHAETTRSTGHTRPVARMTPVILDHGRLDLRMPALRADRASGQAALVVLLAIAFGAVVLARPVGDGVAPPPGSAAASADTNGVAPTEGATVPPDSTAPAAPEETVRPASEPPASVAPASTAPAAEATPRPTTSGATYRVKSGDTLSAIAARFGTTTRVLVQLNDIEDPSRIRIGQILKLP